MGMSGLKKWRLVVPGILIIIAVLFIIQESFSDFAQTYVSKPWNDITYTILAIAIGVLYSILNVRKILWNPYLNRVQTNIKNTLIRAYDQPLSAQQRAYLAEGRTRLRSRRS